MSSGNELTSAILLLILLLAASYVGLFLQRRLHEHHRSRETINSVRLLITILATFSALVLGLLVTSGKSSFDAHTDEVRRYGIQLIQLDARLREYGPQVDAIRSQMRSYTAAVIADTWPDEVVPSGDYPSHLTPIVTNDFESTLLTALLMQADETIQQLVPASPLQERVAPLVRSAMQTTLSERWTLIETAHPTISWPFLVLLMLWLVIIFAIFGLTSPRNTLIHVVILLSAISVASSLYLILDLDTPFGGILTVSSQPLRDALVHMDEPQ